MRRQVSSFNLECLYRRSFPLLSWQPSALPAVLPVVKCCLICNLSVPCWSSLFIFSSTQHNGSVFTQQLPCACCRSRGVISSLLETDSRLVLTSLCTSFPGRIAPARVFCAYPPFVILSSVFSWVRTCFYQME